MMEFGRCVSLEAEDREWEQEQARDLAGLGFHSLGLRLFSFAVWLLFWRANVL